jgi:predicted neuraminidase
MKVACVWVFGVLGFAGMVGCGSPGRQGVVGEEKVEVKDTILTIKSDYIFGDERAFAQCHASTLLRTKDHRYLVAWFGGTHEKHDDVGIWLSRGNPGSWSAPVEVAKLREDPHWNPVLFRAPSGEIILYFKVGRTIDLWETWMMTSADEGKTWSAARELVPGDKGGRGPVRNKPIVLSNGTWVAPSSDEKKEVWNAFVDRSEDNGKTWTRSEFLKLNRDVVPGEGVIQPTLWESAPGKVHMLLRSSAGVICRSDSEDYGKTWTEVYRTELPNPNSGIDLTLTGPQSTVHSPQSDALVLVYNNSTGNWGSRSPISLIMSRDNGETWVSGIDVEKGNVEDEFSYPSIIGYGDTVALTYTWKRQKIAFWEGRIGR